MSQSKNISDIGVVDLNAAGSPVNVVYCRFYHAFVALYIESNSRRVLLEFVFGEYT